MVNGHSIFMYILETAHPIRLKQNHGSPTTVVTQFPSSVRLEDRGISGFRNVTDFFTSDAGKIRNFSHHYEHAGLVIPKILQKKGGES
jgi:hypothetical protein